MILYCCGDDRKFLRGQDWTYLVLDEAHGVGRPPYPARKPSPHSPSLKTAPQKKTAMRAGRPQATAYFLSISFFLEGLFAWLRPCFHVIYLVGDLGSALLLCFLFFGFFFRV